MINVDIVPKNDKVLIAYRCDQSNLSWYIKRRGLILSLEPMLITTDDGCLSAGYVVRMIGNHFHHILSFAVTFYPLSKAKYKQKFKQFIRKSCKHWWLVISNVTITKAFYVTGLREYINWNRIYFQHCWLKNHGVCDWKFHTVYRNHQQWSIDVTWLKCCIHFISMKKSTEKNFQRSDNRTRRPAY